MTLLDTTPEATSNQEGSKKIKPRSLGRGLSALLPDADNETNKGQPEFFPIKGIKPNPYQPRRVFKSEELGDLADSIRVNGIIQPLTAVRINGEVVLIAGERRLRAAQLAGLDAVPVRILEVENESAMLVLSLIENLQRADLNPVELAEGYARLHREYKLTQEQIAARVGKQRATVANTMRLLDLPSPILKSLQDGEITAGHAKVILSVEGVARQSALWKRIVKDNISVSQAEEIARSINQANKKMPLRNRSVSPLLTDYTNRIRSKLATQVRISKRGKRGSIKIDFYSEEELERLVELLESVKN